MNITDYQLSQFMLQSNEIEGEVGLNPKDIEVARKAIELGFNSLDDILSAHRLLTQHLKVNWSGRLRNVSVTVGGNYTPPPEIVVGRMEGFISNLPLMWSWKAHNEFEFIHPFQDFNGRMGRLIWLSKAVKEGYDFSIPFLQKYYYQTLRNQ